MRAVPSTGSERSPWRRRAVIALLILATTNLVVLAVSRTVTTAFRVPSGSMAPALEPGDRILTREVSVDELERGDVVVFDVPDTEGERLAVKRVVALPRESIEARDGLIVIDDDTRLREPWLEEDAADEPVEIERDRMATDEVYVLGDRRGNSIDSREFGPVEEGDIVGRVTFRVWPPLRIGRVS